MKTDQPVAESYEVYDSSRRRHPALEEAIQLFHYRDLLRQFVRRDILTRYKRSLLGIAWTMLNPLGMMLVLTIAFSQIFGARTPGYAAYVLCGLVAWTFFSQTTSAAMVQLVWGSSLMHRIFLPRTAFAVSSIGTGLVNLTLSLIPLSIVILLCGLPLRL
jgi:ABC-2 type transport system permease protein